MESFSLLKYWRGGGGASNTRDSLTKTRTAATTATDSSSSTTTIVTAVSPSSSDSENDNDDDDDGPFFDLEFTLPDESDTEDLIKEERNIAAIVEDFVNENDFEDPSDEQSQEADDDNEINVEDEINFTLSSSSSSDSADPNTALLSPSDDLFFKGSLVPIESSSLSLISSPESDAITKFPVSSILKSATKFRVLMLNFNKSKTNVREKPNKKSEAAAVCAPKEGQYKKQQSKFFTVKLKVEEVPLVSLFTRDNSSKGSKKSNNNEVEISDSSSAASTSSVPDDKKFSKDVMQKYLNKVKPLYIRVSKRYAEKLRLSGQLSFPKSGAGPSPPPPPPAEVKSPPGKSTNVKAGPETSEVGEQAALPNSKSQKQGNLHAGLRVVCKHLGKSRSASSAAAAVAPSAPSTSKRRDDSLLQQQDGIRSAILHCKRSFNASRDLEGSILSRSASDTSRETSMTLSTEDSSSSPEDSNGQRE